MTEILTKIRAKITIIVVENRERYYLIICKCKEVPLSLFSYQMLASTLTTDVRSIYYKVYGYTSFLGPFFTGLQTNKSQYRPNLENRLGVKANRSVIRAILSLLTNE